MGHLVDGVWHTGWYEPDAQGAFQRPPTRFRNRPVEAVAGRYHLYASWACPWAHRTLITRALRGLTDAVGLTIVGPLMGDDGWSLRAEDPDPISGAQHLREIYLRTDPAYTGRVTVPILWDREANTILNNESREVMRIFDVDFAPLTHHPLEPSLAPPELADEIERVLDAIYEPINNGVYRAGFAATQSAYDTAVHELFAALAHWDTVLGDQPFLCGTRMTEADIALFTTLLRFDLVYYAHFKCNLKRLRDHTNLWRFTRQMYQHPGIRPTCHLDDIKQHYYWSQPTVNPTRIIPCGPSLEAELAAALESPARPPRSARATSPGILGSSGRSEHSGHSGMAGHSGIASHSGRSQRRAAPDQMQSHEQDHRADEGDEDRTRESWKWRVPAGLAE